MEVLRCIFRCSFQRIMMSKNRSFGSSYNVTMRKKHILTYVLFIALCLGIGGLSALLTRQGMQEYQSLVQPPLSPPMWLFPVVWGILYTLMGIGAARVYFEHPIGVKKVHSTFFVQLILNFLWSILFFGFRLRLAAFIDLIVLIIAVIVMTVQFYRLQKGAGWLQIPYIVWLLFATYLNMASYILNG